MSSKVPIGRIIHIFMGHHASGSQSHEHWLERINGRENDSSGRKPQGYSYEKESQPRLAQGRQGAGIHRVWDSARCSSDHLACISKDIVKSNAPQILKPLLLFILKTANLPKSSD